MYEYLGIIVFITICAVVIFYMRSLSRIERENLRMQAELGRARQFFDEINDQVEGISRYRHDLKKHIRIVEEFLNEGNNYEEYEEYQDLLRLMSGMQEDVDNTNKKRFCDHEVLNAICEIKLRECEESGVTFEAEIGSPDLSFMDDFHLTGIIMNLLDNALEACQRLTEEEKGQIILKVLPAEGSDSNCGEDADGRSIVISVGNTVHAGEIFDFKTKKKDKSRHGLGLNIAREYAAIYHGTLSSHIDEENHFLLISTVLHKRNDAD